MYFATTDQQKNLLKMKWLAPGWEKLGYCPFKKLGDMIENHLPKVWNSEWIN